MSELKKIANNLPVPEDTPALSLEQLKAVMPARQKQNITQSLVDGLNQMMIEPEYREHFRDNLLSYADVLQDPTTTLKGYIRAVKYVSYKVMGFTNQEAWIKTFPERYQRLCDEDKPEAYLRSLVCAYNKGQIVNRILEQTMVPTWVLNADLFQKALNTQAVLMTSAKSEKVRTDAANSILNHLKRPEAAKLELDMTIKQDDSITKLSEAMGKLVDAQANAIRRGEKTVIEVAEGNIIEMEKE
jgi:hypothetical protein